MDEIGWYMISLRFEIIEGTCEVREKILYLPIVMSFNIAAYRDIKNNISQKIYIFS